MGHKESCCGDVISSTELLLSAENHTVMWHQTLFLILLFKIYF